MEDDVHLTKTEARAGTTTGAMRYVLGISLAAIVILFALILLIWR